MPKPQLRPMNEDIEWKEHEKIESYCVQKIVQLERSVSVIGLKHMSQKRLLLPKMAPILFLKQTGAATIFLLLMSSESKQEKN